MEYLNNPITFQEFEFLIVNSPNRNFQAQVVSLENSIKHLKENAHQFYSIHSKLRAIRRRKHTEVNGAD
jgi:hypothetical protein